MTPDRIVLTLPPDPAFARLTRLATLHFLRQHGVQLVEARRRAASVERHSRTALRTAARAALRTARRTAGRASRSTPRTPGALALTLITRGRALEVRLRRNRGAAARLFVVPRPEGAA